MAEPQFVGTTWSCPNQELVPALDTLRRAGLREAEVWAEGLHLDPRLQPDLPAAERWIAAHELRIRSVHLPFDNVAPGAGADERAARWSALCAETLDYAATLNADLAVAHPVLYFDPDDSRDRAVERFVEAADRIATRARTLGLQLALENMHTLRGPTLQSVEQLRHALRPLPDDVGICLDTGHAVFNGYTGEALTDQIVEAGRLLINTHVHDSDAVGRDPHLVPGEGIVHWPTTMAAYAAIGYQGPYVLEVKGGDDPVTTLQRARDTLIRATRSADGAADE